MGNRTVKTPDVRVSELLSRAAALTVEQDIDLDTFVRRAYKAYFEARPALRDELVEQQLTEQIAELRRKGRLAQA